LAAHIFETIYMLAVTAIMVAFKFLYSNINIKIERLQYMEEAMRALLRDSIIKEYTYRLEKGFCPIYAKQSAREMYDKYHALGGNGTITNLVSEIEGLPSLKND
jgi:hypothetical protein